MNLEGNINKMYLLKAVKWFMIVMPIIVLFFEKHGLSLTQIMILQATYSFTVAILEVPSGFFASDAIDTKGYVSRTVPLVPVNLPS